MFQSTFVLRIPQGTIMKIRSMQTCIMSSLPCCIFRCSVFRYVTLVSFFLFFVQTLLFNCNSFTLVANKYLLTYLLTSSKESKKCKGIKNCVVRKTITFEDYKNCLFSGETSYRSQLMSRSSLHKIQTLEVNKYREIHYNIG